VEQLVYGCFKNLGYVVSDSPVCRILYSGSDLRALCEEAAMMPIRELGPQNILTIKANQVCF
jgi:SpoVK/Ycf46/Vps4 family AAA+-type ATPase